MASVFLDPGHGGKDPGASGFGYLEKNINLDISKIIKQELERHNIKVYLSRDEDKDVSLAERTNKANNLKVNLLVSLHCNAFNTSVYGVETYCFNFKYRKLADNIHNQIINSGLYNSDRGVKEKDLHMLRESFMDAALVEMAFIDNNKDIELLKNKQREFAIAISKGILSYLGVKYQEDKKEADMSLTGAYNGYRVVSGSYKDINNAKEQVEKLKKLGVDSFILPY